MVPRDIYPPKVPVGTFGASSGNKHIGPVDRTMIKENCMVKQSGDMRKKRSDDINFIAKDGYYSKPHSDPSLLQRNFYEVDEIIIKGDPGSTANAAMRR